MTKKVIASIRSNLHPKTDLREYTPELKRLANETADEGGVGVKSRLLRSLAKETRLRILRLLSKKEMCV